MNLPQPILLRVEESRRIHPSFQRVVFRGDGLSRVPENCAGLHIKLFFPAPGQDSLTLPVRRETGIEWPPSDKRPVSRTFSIRACDRQQEKLTVDFVLHPEPGIASDWAANANPGDLLGLAGPGEVTLYDPEAPVQYLIGDLSALPALEAVAEEMPASTDIRVFIELPEGVESRPEWFRGDNIRVSYLVQQYDPESELLPLLRAEGIDPEATGVSLAGEHRTVVALRAWLRSLGLPKPRLYAVPYWRFGDDEEAYHADRHEVMDN